MADVPSNNAFTVCIGSSPSLLVGTSATSPSPPIRSGPLVEQAGHLVLKHLDPGVELENELPVATDPRGHHWLPGSKGAVNLFHLLLNCIEFDRKIFEPP